MQQMIDVQREIQSQQLNTVRIDKVKWIESQPIITILYTFVRTGWGHCLEVRGEPNIERNEEVDVVDVETN